MELVIKTDKERYLQLFSITIPLKWCTHHRSFEGTCTLENLRGENGISLPAGILLTVTQLDEGEFGRCDNMHVYKAVPTHETPIIVEHYFKFKTTDEKPQHTILERNRKIVKRLRRFYSYADIFESGFRFGRFYSADTDIYQTIVEDLKINRKLLNKNFIRDSICFSHDFEKVISSC